MNGFERTGRALKVSRLARVVDKLRAEMSPRPSDEQAAHWLETLGREDRARIHVLAGVTRPASSETWAALIEATRRRSEDQAEEAMFENGGRIS